VVAVNPQIEITLSDPFTLRDLSRFAADAEANGIPRDHPVLVTLASTGSIDEFGRSITTVNLIVRTD
jgi:hypothetical protein